MGEVKTNLPETGIQNPLPFIPFLKFLIFSLIGIFMFFIPITIGDRSSIPLDHIVTWIRSTFPDLVPWYLLITIAIGAIYPFMKGTWKTDAVTIVLTLFKVLGLFTAILVMFEWGPEWLFGENMGPFLFNSLVASVGVLVPIGAIFLAMLTSFGLLEFVGVLMQPIMRPVWKTPGRSAIDAVASFVGSYSVGLLITNRIFKEGKYTIKEAAIIATGFSTVSVTFMLVVARTLELMDLWNLYFWVTMFVTFLVTAITVRIWPLSKMSDGYYEGGEGQPEVLVKKNRLKTAWNSAIETAEKADNNLFKLIWQNLKDGYIMTMGILPSIMSIGLLGMILAKFTPVFDIVGYVFYPFTWILQLPDALLAGKAAAVGIAEMFLPAVLVVNAALVTKFVIAVVCVSTIIFFSATVPCILSTSIPITLTQILVIWLERTILSIIITAPLAFLLL